MRFMKNSICIIENYSGVKNLFEVADLWKSSGTLSSLGGT
jgi:hypothetical protein